ncbi:MAG: hypothetical protein ACOYOB_16875 [Myxococcota bacterium]
MQTWLKRLAFFWISSFLLASSAYYLMLGLLNYPRTGHSAMSPFWGLYRMPAYHWQHPLQYIALPCIFYGLFAASAAPFLARRRFLPRVAGALGLALGAVLVSSPFGGMLWHLHDMQAGWFPQNWLSRLVSDGFAQGLEMGWAVVAVAIPYNLIGLLVSVPLTRYGGRLFAEGGPVLTLRSFRRPAGVAFIVAVLAGAGFAVRNTREVVDFHWRQVLVGGRTVTGTVLEGEKGGEPAEVSGVLVRWFPGERSEELCTVTYDDREHRESLHIMQGDIRWYDGPNLRILAGMGGGPGKDYVSIRTRPDGEEDRTTLTDPQPHDLYFLRVVREPLQQAAILQVERELVAHRAALRAALRIPETASERCEDLIRR